MLQSIAGQAERNEGVVVRPDGTIVVRHRVVLRLGRGHCANAKAGERRVVQERARDAIGMQRACDAGEKAMTSI